MMEILQTVTLFFLILIHAVGVGRAIYLPKQENEAADVRRIWPVASKASHHHGQGHHQTSDLSRTIPFYGNSFHSDKDVTKYLKLYGVQMMIWRCSSAIQLSSVPHRKQKICLHCEVLGTLKSFAWNRRGVQLADNDRYKQQAFAHKVNNTYFSRWLDFKLCIRNVTREDTDTYYFTAISPDGRTEQEAIVVDIFERKPKPKPKPAIRPKHRRKPSARFGVAHTARTKSRPY